MQYLFSGEPTMYPKLDKMIEYLKTFQKTKSIFLVTNGQIPEFFEKLSKNPKALPTQLYISLDAPNKELFDKINISLYEDSWERLKKSFQIFSKLNTRKIIRFTQIKGLNDKEEFFKEYKDIIEIGKPDFIEVKAYMHIGMARQRHTKEQMPNFKEVDNYARKLANYLKNYSYVAASPNSYIVLLKRNDTKYSNRINFKNK
jgi:tRNA wybutosine-synthesizing protein 1